MKPTPEELTKIAAHFAPVFAQKVSKEWKVADQIAPVDFAGKLTSVAENPQHLNDESKIDAKIYYSVCETTTHYLIIYAAYHILDWWKRYDPDNLYDLIRDNLDEHIHDMEGALFVITKEPKNRLDGVVTIAHNHFYLYTNPWEPPDKEPVEDFLRIVKFNESVDGSIWKDEFYPECTYLYIESKGHGMYGDWNHWGGGDEIWYYYPKGKKPTKEQQDRKRERLGRFDSDGVKKGKYKSEKLLFKDYELVDVFAKEGLWAHRFHKKVFLQNKLGKWGFAYQAKKKNKKYLLGGAANPPWSWNDCNDSSPIGEIATDPALMITRYAQGWGPVSTEYLYNPYMDIDKKYDI